MLLFDYCSSAAKYFDLFLTHVEMVFLGTPYFAATSLFERPFSRFLKARNFSPKLFTLSFRLIEDMFLPERCWKKREQTSEETFDDAFIDIQMLEMNSIIHSKTSLKCSR